MQSVKVPPTSIQNCQVKETTRPIKKSQRHGRLSELKETNSPRLSHQQAWIAFTISDLAMHYPDRLATDGDQMRFGAQKHMTSGYRRCRSTWFSQVMFIEQLKLGFGSNDKQRSVLSNAVHPVFH